MTITHIYSYDLVANEYTSSLYYFITSALTFLYVHNRHNLNIYLCTTPMLQSASLFNDTKKHRHYIATFLLCSYIISLWTILYHYLFIINMTLMYSAVKFSLTSIYIWQPLTPPRHKTPFPYFTNFTPHIAIIVGDTQVVRRT